MPFRLLSTIVAALSFVLFLNLVLLPDMLYLLFGQQGNPLGDFLAKRAGVLFLGFAILCFLARNTTSKEVENLVVTSIGIMMAAMALLGIFEFLRGNAGAGILLAVAGEIAIAVFSLRIWRNNRAA